MTGAADRRARGERNRLVRLLDLGRPAPLVDLPVLVTAGSLGPDAAPTPPSAEPVMVPFGGSATVTIEDAELGVTYRVRADSGATSLSNRRAQKTATERGRLDLEVPRIDRTVMLSVEATTPDQRTAFLSMGRAVEVGLDRGLPVTAEGAVSGPIVVDYGTRVTVKLLNPQDAVAYTLVRRSPDDETPDEKVQDVEDAGLSPRALQPGEDGTTLTFNSEPLDEDCVLRIRADRSFGKGQRRAALMTARVAVHVRADPNRAVTLVPPVCEHLATPKVTIAEAQRGVRYDLVIGTLADAQLSRGGLALPGTVVVDAEGVTVRAAVPTLGRTWQPIPGHEPSGAGGEGRGGTLVIPTPPLGADSTIVVRAVKRHGTGEAAKETEVPLATPLVALVRPDPARSLGITATIADGMLTGVAIENGQPGVFYRVTADGADLGELYVHQVDPGDPARNKGVGRIGIDVDLAIAADLASKAPPPVPRLQCAVPLPVTLDLGARRATTSLRRAMRARVRIDAPALRVEGGRGLTGPGLTVTVADAASAASYRLLVDGKEVGDPGFGRGAGGGGPLALASGPVPRASVVELRVIDPPANGISVTRRIVVAAG